MADSAWREQPEGAERGSTAYSPWTPGGLIARFDTIVDRYPDKIAVDDGARTLSFRQIREAAQALSAELVRVDIPDGRPVAVLLPASVLYPVALLAGFALGRPLTPIDGTHPIERQRAILEEARPAAILIDPDRPPAPELLDTQTKVIPIRLTLDEGSVWPPVPAPDALAGIAFTSGSMGRPKGLAYRQEAIWRIATDHIDAVGAGPDDVVLSLASLGAGGNQDLLTGLLTGARVRMLEIKSAGIGETLRVLREDGVTLLAMIPLVLRTLMQQEGASEAFARMRMLTCGGDRLFGEDVRLFHSILPPTAGVRFTQGATETGVVFHWIVPRGLDAPDGQSIPSGRVSRNHAVFLTAGDAEGEGETNDARGELMVSGDCLAAGAWRAGELVKGPFADSPDLRGGRVYDTGDIVEALDDGLYRFVGRRDRQIKMRGLRADPAEVEAALRKSAGVGDVAVIPRYRDAEAVFIAYVAPDSLTTPPDVLELRESLAGEIAPHMIPAEIIYLPSLPRLPNYKIDLAALKAVDALNAGAARSATQETAPASNPEIARTIGAAWRDILGPTANGRAFDEAGGDSLKLLQLSLLLERTLGVDSLLDTLHIRITESELVARLTTPGEQAEGQVVYLCPGIGGDEPRLAGLRRALRGQVRFVTIPYPDIDRPVAEIRSLEPMIEALLSAINERPRDHPIAMLGYSAGGMVAFDAAARLRAAGRDVRLLGLIDVSAERKATAHWARYDWGGFGNQVAHQGFWATLKDRVFVTLLELKAYGLLRRLILMKSRKAGLHSVAFVRKQLIDRLRGAAALEWRPSPYEGRVTLFRAAAQRDPDASADLGWSRWAAGVTVHDCPGDHLTLLDSPNVEALARAVVASLKAAEAAE